MGIEKDFSKVKLFAGFIYHNSGTYRKVIGELENEFSVIDLASAEISFDKTTYYHEEMGSPLFKRFVSFSNLISPEKLPDIKIYCNQIERERAVAGRRAINLDPGYLSIANVVIATTKNHYHRIPLSRGIYAHMEYIFKKNKVETLPWTYPDFREEVYIDFFRQLKLLYRVNLQQNTPG